MIHPIANTDDTRRDENLPNVDVPPVEDVTPNVATETLATPLRSAPKPTHVLDRGGPTKSFWKIRPAELVDFVNLTDYDYEIVVDYLNAPSAKINIRTEDRIEIRTDGSSIDLTHFNDGITIGRGRNFQMVGGLWAIGDATVPPSNTVVGQYVLYLLENSVKTRHRNSVRLGETGECAQVHFEYFEAGDAEAESHRPKIGTNVFDIDKHELGGKRETDEGDGDEGRRR